MSRPYLSLIIPAYNEAQRISTTLAEVYVYLQSQPYSSEVIVVDDGSSDATGAILAQAQAWFVGLRVIANQHRGKAVAVRTGVLAAAGDYVMFADADLSTPLTEIARPLDALHSRAEVAIGSREGIGAQRIGEPSYRHVMGRGFNWLTGLIVGQPFRDTQCGFKGFRRAVALRLFQQCRLYGDDAPVLKRSAVTAFDVEILFLALLNGYRIEAIPVEWHYRAGSKVNPLADSLHLLCDLVRIRWNAVLGRYSSAGDESAVVVAE